MLRCLFSELEMTSCYRFLVVSVAKRCFWFQYSFLIAGKSRSCVIYLQLLSARDMAQRTFIGQDRIVYSTDRDLYEQDYDAKQWDQRFREIEKSD